MTEVLGVFNVYTLFKPNVRWLCNHYLWIRRATTQHHKQLLSWQCVVFSGKPHGSLRTSVSVSAQDGMVALGKAHARSAPSLSSLPKVSFETVPIFAWLNTDRTRPLRVECRPLHFSTPLSFGRSVL